VRTKKNELYCGENLEILQNYISKESIDLVYLDPPFNSKQDFNLIFRESDGKRSSSQELVFEDTWRWNEKAEETCRALIESAGPMAEVIHAFKTFLGTSDMMAYLAMMAPRLQELWRVLKYTGSLFLHCDPTSAHYLKMLLDSIFGPQQFRNEIVWKRKAGRGETNKEAIRFGVTTDVLLFYAKSAESNFYRQYRPSNPNYIKTKFTHTETDGRKYRLDNITSPSYRPNLVYEYKGHHPPKNGWAVSPERMKEMDEKGRLYIPANLKQRIQRKRYLDELPGETVDSLWDDIAPVNSQAIERQGYPTQKPEALLERIIAATTQEGEIVLDPFCGCGTAVIAAQRLNRRWIGIDVTHLATAIIKQRLANNFSFHVFKDVRLIGEPINSDEALALARDDKFRFQCWAVGKIGAPPIEHKQGADRGIDGRIYFHDDFGAPKQIIISVKAGENIGPAFVRELRGVIEREKAEMGIMISIKEPTREMQHEAKRAGSYLSINGSFPRLQFITVDDMFANKPLNIPGRLNPYERKKPAGVKQVAEQLRLLP
jgi:site-specific DNA-methyltransferase (adenine-specific)